jgi:hypothetical protein
VPAEGVVNALRTIHAALAPGGLVVDTQPVSPDPPVAASSGELGRLDMREWGRTIELIDDRFETAIREGLFAVDKQRSFIVTEAFDDAAEMLTTVRDWRGTRIPTELEQRVARARGPVHVHQDIRLRLLRAL